MERKAFLKQSEAFMFARQFAKENNGYIGARIVAVGCSGFDTPEEIGSWSGDVAAYEVISEESFEVIGYVAFWEID